MDKKLRNRIIWLYAGMTAFSLAFNYVFQHLLLGLPLWYVVVLSALTQAALTFATVIAARRLGRRR